MTVTDNEGTTSTVSRQIIANAPPTATFVVKCGAGLCTFDASGSADPDGTITSYEWTFGDGATLYQPAGIATATHSYRTGTFTVQLVVRDNVGASATASATCRLSINPPVASFVTTCDGVRCTFNASTSADPEGRALQYYSWNFGDGYGTYGTAIQQHTYAAPGTYRVVLTVADDSGQPATVQSTITVQPGSMHIGDLDGTSTPGARGSSIVNVTVVVHDGDHRRGDLCVGDRAVVIRRSGRLLHGRDRTVHHVDGRQGSGRHLHHPDDRARGVRLSAGLITIRTATAMERQSRSGRGRTAGMRPKKARVSTLFSTVFILAIGWFAAPYADEAPIRNRRGGSVPVRLTTNAAADTNPDWSPKADGTVVKDTPDGEWSA